MSVGYRTRRIGLSFNDCRAGGPFQPGIRYPINAGNSSQHGIAIEVAEQAAGTEERP
jgi:hypothetical protein